jgi:hypothetical protein
MRWTFAASFTVIVLLGGCESGGPKTYPVSGTVTWNAQPLADGNITFIDLDKAGLEHAGKIAEGKFQCQVAAGKKKVVITASREVGKVDPAMGAAPRQQYIPARYSDPFNTTLRAEVKPDGDNTLPPFTLKEK